MGNAAEQTDHTIEVANFLDSLFEGQQGYIYIPTKSDESNFWQEYYFKWPIQREAAITHILVQKERDVYVSPSIFKAPKPTPQCWGGSNFAWVEFDGNAPSNPPNGIPTPSIRIQSSNAGHEHWYWRLREFEQDRRILEGLSKQLAYTLDADKSGWDCTQVLRPPGTLHTESRKRTRLLSSGPGIYSYGDFKGLVAAPETAIVDTSISDLPDIQEVIAKYKWPVEATNLFQKRTQPVGSRSSAMTALGFHCIEMGMTNNECYVVLFNADERWGKYKNRNPADRAKRLLGIISHCRGKKELDLELNLNRVETFVSVGDFRRTDIKIKWIFENFLAERGLGILSAQPGVGKSTLSFRLGISAVLGKDFLIWKNRSKPLRVGFVSLEMAGAECRKFLDDMWPSFSSEEHALIEENFFLMPLGYSLPLGNKTEQQLLLDAIDYHNIDLIIVDSLKAATGLDEKKTDLFFDWLNKYVRNDRGLSVWIVHHNRKPPNEGSRKPKGLEDLYGDTFIGAHPTTVISLWRRSKGILEVLPFKIRLAQETDPFTIRREPNLNFSIDKVLDKNESEQEDGTSKKSNLFG